MNYYVSVRDAGRYGLLVGPFAQHQHALDLVEQTRRAAEKHDPWAAFYAFGTCGMPDDYTKPGILNADIAAPLPEPAQLKLSEFSGSLPERNPLK